MQLMLVVEGACVSILAKLCYCPRNDRGVFTH